ncbi:unnamed protein product, partial [Tetraodon nigroviridis]
PAGNIPSHEKIGRKGEGADEGGDLKLISHSYLDTRGCRSSVQPSWCHSNDGFPSSPLGCEQMNPSTADSPPPRGGVSKSHAEPRLSWGTRIGTRGDQPVCTSADNKRQTALRFCRTKSWCRDRPHQQISIGSAA